MTISDGARGEVHRSPTFSDARHIIDTYLAYRNLSLTIGNAPS